MADLDLSRFLQGISDDMPCGEDLEYDPLFQQLQQESEGTPERRVGDSVIPAVEPDWKSVNQKCMQLLTRTRDASLGVYLTRSLLNLHGLEGLWRGVGLIRGMLENFWDCIYPVQDPDDDYPVLRMNVIASLNDHATFLNPIRNIPLTESNVMGRFTLRDIDYASGRVPLPEHIVEPPKSAEIDAAFMDTGLEVLQRNNGYVESCLAELHAIGEVTRDKVGEVNAPDLSDLVSLLRQMNTTLNQQIVNCGGAVEAAAGDDAVATSSGSPRAGGVGAPTAGINSRDDVKQALDAICDYYARQEPSSPIPFILKRARRLIYKDFREILQDLAPEGVGQAQTIFGDMEGENP